MDCTCRLVLVDIISGFSLICAIGSAYHTQKLIRDNEYWIVIGWCKKTNKGLALDQRHEHYINWCFTLKTPSFALFWK